jgi:predicted nucleic acid-binding protein
VALTHVADTSVLTRLTKPTVMPVVAAMLKANQIARCAMSDLEIGYAARNSDEWDALRRAIKYFPLVTVEAVDFDRAAGVQRTLAAMSQRGRKVPDLLIAAAAERRGLAVLHYDHDFEMIGEATGQSTQWVVPRGSAD